MQVADPKLAPLRSIPGVCDVEFVTEPGARPVLEATHAADLLIEVPHGATRRSDFEATRSRLVGKFPEDLEAFFYVNTDVGAIECARWVARMVVSPSEYPELERVLSASSQARRPAIRSVLIVRGLVARTFVDLNRVVPVGHESGRVAPAGASGMTPVLPKYITRAEDAETLLQVHGEYQALSADAYALVCSEPGSAGALMLHTYAPRSVEIETVDETIVTALRRAYEPSVFRTLPRRPDVDLITQALDGTQLASEVLARSVREEYARMGIEARENESYRLHESSMGYVHSAKYPCRVLCLEINRELLADPFAPFVEMSISESKARRMAGPIAAALLASSSSKGGMH